MAHPLIWDLPTRVFHWLFAVGFLATAFIALVLGEHSLLFPYHAIIGLALGLMVALRLIWGFVGTRYSRFGSFVFGPAAVASYLKGIVTGRGERFVGHNPGSAYAIFAMLTVFAGLAVTGVMLGKGNEGVKELHEVLAYSLLAIAGVHILGVIVHLVRHRENLAAGMIHGRKQAEESAAIRSSQPVVAIVFLAATAAWTIGLLNSFDAGTQSTKLPLLGTRLQLGEAEGADTGARHTPERPGGHRDDD